MKLLKGFGKNYFTLSAILASSVEQKLQSQVSSLFSLLHKNISQEEKELEEEEPPCELLLVTSTLKNKPCHCNCFYKLKTRLALLSYHYIPRCPYYTTYFAFRRTGIHPPLLQL